MCLTTLASMTNQEIRWVDMRISYRNSQLQPIDDTGNPIFTNPESRLQILQYYHKCLLACAWLGLGWSTLASTSEAEIPTRSMITIATMITMRTFETGLKASCSLIFASKPANKQNKQLTCYYQNSPTYKRNTSHFPMQCTPCLRSTFIKQST